MPDEADLANDYAMREIEQRILDVQSAKPIAFDGMCLNQCDEPARDGSRYCSAECLADHDRMLRHLKRSGAQ